MLFSLLALALSTAAGAQPGHPRVVVHQAGRGVVCEPSNRPAGKIVVGLRMPIRVRESAGVDIELVSVRAVFTREGAVVAEDVMTTDELAAAGPTRVRGGRGLTVHLAHDVTLERAGMWDSLSFVVGYRMAAKRSAFVATLEPPFDLAIGVPSCGAPIVRPSASPAAR